MSFILFTDSLHRILTKILTDKHWYWFKRNQPDVQHLDWNKTCRPRTKWHCGCLTRQVCAACHLVSPFVSIAKPLSNNLGLKLFPNLAPSNSSMSSVECGHAWVTWRKWEKGLQTGNTSNDREQNYVSTSSIFCTTHSSIKKVIFRNHSLDAWKGQLELWVSRNVVTLYCVFHLYRRHGACGSFEKTLWFHMLIM